jgi:pilus assembly protein Flp/PilA
MKNTFLKLYVKVQVLKDAIVSDESGQDLIEYALVVSLIALAATAGMGTVATKIGTAFTSVGTKLGTYTS